MARNDCVFSCLALGVGVNKTEYLASRKGELHSVIIATQPMINVIGSIRGADLRNVVAILASGLQHRLDNAPDSELRTALLTAFKYLGLPDYAINLSIPENQALLAMSVAAGLVSEHERAQLFALATYQKPEYDITSADFMGEWHELPATSETLVKVRLKTKAPEQTHLSFEICDQYHDGTRSDWYHATALYGVELARIYTAHLPINGYPRKVRWRCEYDLEIEVSV